MIKALFIFLISLIVAVIISIFNLDKLYRKEIKELNENEAKKTAEKESMETGDNSYDFDQSINILHEHAKK